MTQYSMGVIGLGVMGQNLALNIESKGFPVIGFDLDAEKLKASAQKWAGKKMKTAASLKELVESLEKPRKILIMVPAGKPVDAVINDLKPLLSAGDILIDGGNSFFQDTDRRASDDLGFRRLFSRWERIGGGGKRRRHLRLDGWRSNLDGNRCAQ